MVVLMTNNVVAMLRIIIKKERIIFIQEDQVDQEKLIVLSMVVAHIYLHTVPEILRDTTLAESGIMSEHKLMIMMVKSPDADARQANGNTVLQPKDTIMVLGKRQTIRDVFESVDLTQGNADSPVFVHNK